MFVSEYVIQMYFWTVSLVSDLFHLLGVHMVGVLAGEYVNAHSSVTDLFDQASLPPRSICFTIHFLFSFGCVNAYGVQFFGQLQVMCLTLLIFVRECSMFDGFATRQSGPSLELEFEYADCGYSVAAQI